MPGKDKIEHHIWCNYFKSGSPETCWMCADLKKHYPEGNLSEDELMTKHFPDNKKVADA